jgi:hypothetical protein
MTDEHDPEAQIEDENPFERRSGYEVGYGKPPRQHQFRKGNKAAAGNRKRRKPRGIAQILLKIAGETVDVGLNGKRVRMTRKEALMRQLFEKAMKSPRDGMHVTQLMLNIEDQMPFDPGDQPSITIEFVGSRPKGLPGGPADD